MSNAFATPKVYANVGLALLKNQLVMAKLIDSEAVNKEFKPGVGVTVYVKRPPEFAIRNGSTASAQDVTEGEVAVTCDQQKGVDVQFTGYEATANVDQLLKSRVIAGAMTQIASQIDGDLINNVKYFNNWVGTPGNTVSTVAGFFNAPQRLDEMAVPMSDRSAVMTPGDGYAIASTFTGLAALAGDTAKNALQKAKIPMLGNVDPYITQTIPSIMNGRRTNQFVAPTSFITSTSRRRAKIDRRIVLPISSTAAMASTTPMPSSTSVMVPAVLSTRSAFPAP